MKILLLGMLFMSFSAFGQNEGTSLAQIQKTINETLASKWYERIQLRGYADFRYNRAFESNNKLTCSACDKSIGNKKGFFLRRARLVFFGEVNDKVYIYIQPDYATDATNGTTTGQNYLQIRDAYFDYALSDDKEFRVRTGISKVPFGFENLQSSGNRAPLDRSDAINTAAPNERDIGVFFMYAPTEIRKRFKELTSNNLKGTGDYGMIAFGAYNGQTVNREEKNNDLHRVLRVTYPHKFENGQFIEASVQAYEGKFFVDGVNKNFYDQRTGASFVIYPQPIGFQIEYNSGLGPEFDPKLGAVKDQSLRGGYIQMNYQTYFKDHRLFPYIRYGEYKGGRKLEVNSTSYKVSEIEFGSEWQPNAAFELTAAYAKSDRFTQSSASNKLHEGGHLVRLQAQFNY